MELCPRTGKPCSNPKVIHVTDISSDYTAKNSYNLCQVCGTDQPEPIKAQLHPIVKNLFDLLSLILTSKQKQAQVNPPPPEPVIPEQPLIPEQPPHQNKPPCPSCGMTLFEIGKTSRLGCPYCYEHYKIELIPVLIHAHKSTEHVGKKPKPKAVVLEELPGEEQIRLLEIKIKQAVDQEQYEKAKEYKDKLSALKAANPQSEQLSD